MHYLVARIAFLLLCAFVNEMVNAANNSQAEESIEVVALGDRIVPDAFDNVKGTEEERLITDAAGNMLLLKSTFRPATAFASNVQLFALESEHRIGMCLYKHVERPARYGTHSVEERVLVSCGAEISYIFQPHLRYTLQIKRIGEGTAARLPISFFVFFNSPLTFLLHALLPPITYSTFGADFYTLDLLTRKLSRLPIDEPETPRLSVATIDACAAPFYNVHSRSLTFFFTGDAHENASSVLEIQAADDKMDRIKKIEQISTEVYVVLVESKSIADLLHRIDP